MSRAEWTRRTGAAGLLLGAATAYAWVGGDPLVVALGGAVGGYGLLVQLRRTVVDPGLGFYAPAITRGRHPGRVALLFHGIPTPGREPFGATCFVADAVAAQEVAALGLEPGLDATGPGGPRVGAPSLRWVTVRRVYPGRRMGGLTVVVPTRTAATAGEAADLGDGVYGTDLVRLPLLPPEDLDRLLRRWSARGIEATSLSKALEPG